MGFSAFTAAATTEEPPSDVSKGNDAGKVSVSEEMAGILKVVEGLLPDADGGIIEKSGLLP